MAGASVVYGDFDPMQADVQRLQGFCDDQNTAMQQLGSMLEGLSSNMVGQAGQAMVHNLGAQMQQQGTQIAHLFSDHSQQMSVNVQQFQQNEEASAGLLNSIAGLH